MTDAFTSLTPPVAADDPAPVFADGLRARIDAIEARSDRAARRAGNVTWHLAQLNLGLFKAPLDAPEMQPFVAALDRINEIADASPGFVWRLKGDDGEPSSYVEVPGANDPLLASNLSVWTNLESLRDFMYRTDHASYLRRRAEWFDREKQPMTVAWWISAGTLPTLADAVRRLDHLREHGESDEGFHLSRTVPPPPATQQATTQQETSDMPTQTFIPYLTVGDSRAAMQFYAEVFGAEQSGEFFEMDDGRVGHCEMTLDSNTFYMADEFAEMKLQSPSEQGSNSVSLVINVDDCDAVYEHAVAAGATSERPPANQHGHRSGWFVDPWGHRWSPTSPAKPGML